MNLGYSAEIQHTWILALLKTLGFNVEPFYYLTIYDAFTTTIGRGLNERTTMGYRMVHSNLYKFNNRFNTKEEAFRFMMDHGFTPIAPGNVVFMTSIRKT